MASRATVLIDTPDLILVRIDHLDTDSFSRSVLPRATAAWRRTNNCRGVRYSAAELAVESLVDGRHCLSFVAYAHSHSAAKGALAATVESLEARA